MIITVSDLCNDYHKTILKSFPGSDYAAIYLWSHVHAAEIE